LRRDPRPREQTWKTFIENHKDVLAWHRHHPLEAQGAGLDERYPPLYRGMDRSTNHRSLPVGSSAAASPP
jgi:hypothetical protein